MCQGPARSAKTRVIKELEMKRYLVISFLVVGLAMGGVSSAHPQGGIDMGVWVKSANVAMDDLNNTIEADNLWIEGWALWYEFIGIDVDPEYLEEIKSGMEIGGYLGIDITDMLALRFIGGYFSKETSGGWYSTDGIDEETVTQKYKVSSYFGGIEPEISFELGKATVCGRAGLAYYLATLNYDYSYEATFAPSESETLTFTGTKLGYHARVAGQFALTERVEVEASIGYRSTGEIDVEGNGSTAKLDFGGMFYGVGISVDLA